MQPRQPRAKRLTFTPSLRPPASCRPRARRRAVTRRPSRRDEPSARRTRRTAAPGRGSWRRAGSRGRWRRGGGSSQRADQLCIKITDDATSQPLDVLRRRKKPHSPPKAPMEKPQQTKASRPLRETAGRLKASRPDDLGCCAQNVSQKEKASPDAPPGGLHQNLVRVSGSGCSAVFRVRSCFVNARRRLGGQNFGSRSRSASRHSLWGLMTGGAPCSRSRWERIVLKTATSTSEALPSGGGGVDAHADQRSAASPRPQDRHRASRRWR